MLRRSEKVCTLGLRSSASPAKKRWEGERRRLILKDTERNEAQLMRIYFKKIRVVLQGAFILDHKDDKTNQEPNNRSFTNAWHNLPVNDIATENTSESDEYYGKINWNLLSRRGYTSKWVASLISTLIVTVKCTFSSFIHLWFLSFL